MKRIILGSNSPRRRELLAALDLPFTVDTGNTFEEHYAPGTPAEEIPCILSRGKSHGFHRPLADDEVLITADTVVIDGARVLGKPRDRAEAFAMLRELSGKTHAVITGVTIRDTAREETFSDTARVTFRALSDEEIGYYIDTYKPFDKAGAYGIQEWIGYAAITRLEGSFYNVMGFPTHAVYSALQRFL